MSETPDNFEPLLKLLKLKRFEQPPPGYFNDFSGRVINRIERQSLRPQGLAAQVPWLYKFLRLLETNPVAAGLFGFSICGLLVGGIAYSQYQTPYAAATSNLTLGLADAGTTPHPTDWNLKSTGVETVSLSTDPMQHTNLPGSLFSGPMSLTAEPVSYSSSH